MKTVNFTALEAGEHITKPINKTLATEVAKVRALFGDVDFYWVWTAPADDSDGALSFYLDDDRRFTLVIYADGSKPFFG